LEGCVIKVLEKVISIKLRAFAEKRKIGGLGSGGIFPAKAIVLFCLDNIKTF